MFPPTILLVSLIRLLYLAAACIVVALATRSSSNAVTMGVALAFAGPWVLIEIVMDAVGVYRRNRALREWRKCVDALISFADDGDAADRHEFTSKDADSDEGFGGLWRCLREDEQSNRKAFEEKIHRLSEFFSAINVFIPQAARVSDKRFSSSPTLFVPTNNNEPLVHFEPIDESSPPAPPQGSFASPAPSPHMVAQEQHIQMLMAAIKKPNEAVLPILPPAGTGVNSPPTELDIAKSPTVMNDSVVSPQRRSLGRSFLASPRASPSLTYQRRGQSRLGAFRRAEKMTDVSAEHCGTVLVLNIRLPGSDTLLPPPDIVEHVSAAVGRCVHLITEYGGVVYYFDLTHLVATFHVLQPCVDHARCAVFAGLAISHAMEGLSGEDVSFGVGIALGNLVAGDLGTEQFRSCVIHGPVLAEASDLSTLNYCLQTRVLVSEALHDSIQSGVVTMLVDFIASTEQEIPSLGDRKSGLIDSKGVFEARGAEISFDESCGDGVAPAQRIPHEALILYLEAFFCLRKGSYDQAAERLASMPQELLDNDPQVQRLLKLAVFFRDQAMPPNTYVRSRFARWEGLEDLCDQGNRHASPSYAGRKAAQLSHESPTRIIEAVMRARSCTPAAPTPNPSGTMDPPSLNGDFDGTTNSLCISMSASSEFADVGGILWRKSEKLLGKGAFGEVYLGMRVDDGKLVAIKQLKIPEIVSGVQGGRLRRTLQRERHELDALVREIKMLCGLRHPNIVFFLGCGVVSHDILINLEYVSGGSLQSILEEFGSIPIPAAQRYLKDVLRGLDFLHNKGIIHRDVKPANVLLHVDGGCKVTDFGTSIQIQNILDNNIVVGTPVYMSPEQAVGSKTTCVQSDLWSVGIMTIQLLSGSLPFEVNGAVAAHQHMHRLATDPSFTVAIPDGLPVAATSFISQCLRREPTSRGTAQELLMHPFLFAASTPSHPTPLRQKSATFSPSPPNSESGSLSPVHPQLESR